MPASERQYLASQGCGGWNAALQSAGMDGAKSAADLLRGLGQRVSGVIACKGDKGGMTPPFGIPTPLRLPSRAGARPSSRATCLLRRLAAAGVDALEKAWELHPGYLMAALEAERVPDHLRQHVLASWIKTL